MDMDEPARHREYGRGRWSGGWLDALAELPGAAPGQLIRGRAYAREGRVSELHIEPGIISALVQDDRPRPYPVALTVPVLDDVAWDRFIGALAARAEYLAALLDGEPPAVIGAERTLLPGPGRLRTVCTCLERDRQPCRHTAATCYQTAAVFDEDPFALLLLRGRSRPQVLAALRERRGLSPSVSPSPSMPTAPGRLARDAYRTVPGPLPSCQPPPASPSAPAPALHADDPGPTGHDGPRPGRVSAEPPAEPPAASGLSRSELTQLAERAARLARELLATHTPPAAEQRDDLAPGVAHPPSRRQRGSVS